MKNLGSLVVALFAILGMAVAFPQVEKEVSFEGHKVLRFHVKTRNQVEVLKRTIETYNLDLWSSLHLNSDVDIRVPPSALSHLTSLKIPYDIFIPNLAKLIAEERRPSTESRSDDYFADYHSYEDTETWLNGLLSQYPKLASRVDVGTTYEGKKIWGLKVTGTGAGPKKGFVIHGGIHAREWITVATVSFTLNELLTKYGTDAEITKLLDYFSFTIIPILNVDGYRFTWSGNRMWRKNRQPNSGSSSCVGTDPNRNFAYKWGTGGSSSNPCADDYKGPSAGSAPETAAIQAFVKNEAPVAYIDVHAYSQLWMYPFGYSCSASNPDSATLNAGAQKAISALKAVNGLSFAYGDICNTIYQASGSSADHMYGANGVKFSYAVELRDKGRYGFVLPANQIKPAALEFLAAFKALGGHIIGFYNSKKN